MQIRRKRESDEWMASSHHHYLYQSMMLSSHNQEDIAFLNREATGCQEYCVSTKVTGRPCSCLVRGDLGHKNMSLFSKSPLLKTPSRLPPSNIFHFKIRWLQKLIQGACVKVRGMKIVVIFYDWPLRGQSWNRRPSKVFKCRVNISRNNVMRGHLASVDQ